MTAQTDYQKARAEAGLARTRLSASVAELKHRVSPPVLASDAMASARERAEDALASAKEKASDAFGSARTHSVAFAGTAKGAAERNPLLAGAAGAGVALLLFRRPISALVHRLSDRRSVQAAVPAAHD